MIMECLNTAKWAIITAALLGGTLSCSSTESQRRSQIHGSALREIFCGPQPLVPNAEAVAYLERPQTLADVRAGSEPSPQIVLRRTHPMRGVIGSESPQFALYDDRTLIFGDPGAYRSVRLSQNEYQRIVQEVERISDRNRSGYYDANPGVTDQPSYSLLNYLNADPVFITVYGDILDAGVASCIPEELAEVMVDLGTYRNSFAQPWLPSEIEVMIWPYEYAPDESIIWPDRWPGLADPRARRRGDSYSLFLPASELGALRNFLSTRSSRGAVEIDGRKWAAAIRFPFPHEVLWMGPNPEVE